VPAKKAPKKSAGKKAVAKKLAPKKALAKKPVAKKRAAKKSAPKKATPKKATPKKPTAKKSAARKSAAKKAAPRKPTAKKSASKKAAPKKPTARKSTPKKAAPKKPTARKSTPKKAAPKKAAAKKSASEKSAPKKKAGRRGDIASSPELNGVSCQLALLALAQEETPLGVRQIEQLRRALAIAGDALGWTEKMSNNGDSVAALGVDVIAMAESGAKSLGRDLAEQLVIKKTEITQLNDVIAHARALAEDEKTVYPAEIIFSHTVKDAYQELVTKTETKIVNEASEALSAAASVERSLTSWSKLAELMILDLKKKQRQLEGVSRALPDFIEYSQNLLGEVVANLS